MRERRHAQGLPPGRRSGPAAAPARSPTALRRSPPPSPLPRLPAGIVHCGQTVIAEEGTRALWKGLTPFATHLTLKYALRMGSNSVYQGLLRDQDGKLTSGKRLAAGFMAGEAAAAAAAGLRAAAPAARHCRRCSRSSAVAGPQRQLPPLLLPAPLPPQPLPHAQPRLRLRPPQASRRRC
jgi:hypothetical protein